MRLPVLFWLLAVCVQYGKAAEASCGVPKDALRSEAWKEIRTVPVGAVAFYSTPFGWEGLDQIYPSSIVAEHRWRAFLPWGAPTTVEYFDGKRSVNVIANAQPVLYLKGSALDTSLPYFLGAEVRLSPLKQVRNERALSLTRGATSFTQKGLYTTPQDLPVVVQKVSDSTIEVQPRAPLRDGEYLLSLGMDATAKYEFSVHCSN